MQQTTKLYKPCPSSGVSRVLAVLLRHLLPVPHHRHVLHLLQPLPLRLAQHRLQNGVLQVLLNCSSPSTKFTILKRWDCHQHLWNSKHFNEVLLNMSARILPCIFETAARSDNSGEVTVKKSDHHQPSPTTGFSGWDTAGNYKLSQHCPMEILTKTWLRHDNNVKCWENIFRHQLSTEVSISSEVVFFSSCEQTARKSENECVEMKTEATKILPTDNEKVES